MAYIATEVYTTHACVFWPTNYSHLATNPQLKPFDISTLPYGSSSRSLLHTVYYSHRFLRCASPIAVWWQSGIRIQVFVAVVVSPTALSIYLPTHNFGR